jgi:hypothetical protein
MSMTTRATRPIVGALWIVPTLSCVVAAFMLYAQPAPAEAADPATPPAGRAPDADSGAQTTSTTSTTIPDAAARGADCKRYVAALSGDPKERALLEAAEVKQLAKNQVDLLTCRAVKEDSDEPCKLLDNENAVNSCRAMRSTFHELREHPNSRAFMFNDVQYEACQGIPPLQQFCEKARAAARAGDPSKCDGLGEFKSNCRAIVTLDKSLCTAPKVEGLQGRDQGSSQTYAENIREDCRHSIESMSVYASGLKGIAKSGPPLDQQLAKAALQEPDACTSFANAAAKTCAATASPAEAPGHGKPATAPQKDRGGEAPAPPRKEPPG